MNIKKPGGPGIGEEADVKPAPQPAVTLEALATRIAFLESTVERLEGKVRQLTAKKK